MAAQCAKRHFAAYGEKVMRDNVNRIKVRAGFSLPVFKTNQTSATFDRMASDGGYESLTLYLLAGTWTDGTHAFQIQHSDDGATWSNVSSTAFDTEQNASFASITSAPTAMNQKVGYIGGKRYVQVISTVGGAPATGAAYQIVGVFGDAHNQPTSV
jgi:hypothetical protein